MQCLKDVAWWLPQLLRRLLICLHVSQSAGFGKACGIFLWTSSGGFGIFQHCSINHLDFFDCIQNGLDDDKSCLVMYIKLLSPVKVKVEMGNPVWRKKIIRHPRWQAVNFFGLLNVTLLILRIFFKSRVVLNVCFETQTWRWQLLRLRVWHLLEGLDVLKRSQCALGWESSSKTERLYHTWWKSPWKDCPLT